MIRRYPTRSPLPGRSRGRTPGRLRWLLAITVGLIGCSRGPAPNVIVILVDTLRADRLGVYDPTRHLTPFLDQWARDGVVVRQAMSEAPWTNPSVASLFTAQFQSQHGVVTFTSSIADTSATLAEAMRARGYRTAAVVANWVVLGQRGYGRGFDTYRTLETYHDYLEKKVRAPEVDAAALEWLDHQPADDHRPMFLYLHYVEPHTPYTAPPEVLRELYGDSAPDLEEMNVYVNLVGAVVEPDIAKKMAQAYDAEVRAFDAEMQTFFGELRRRGVLDGALVVFTSDHGEQFQEHGLVGHGKTLHGEELHVPLIFHWPGHVRAGVLDGPVSLVDVAPTILRLVGAAAPPSFSGHAFALDQPRPIEPVFSELLHDAAHAEEKPDEDRVSMLLGARKVIRRQDGVDEFYDLATDPTEQHPAALTPPERTALLEMLAGSVPMRAIASRGTISAPPVDPDTAARMKALGYTR